MVISEESRSLHMKPPLTLKIETWGGPAFKKQVLPILPPHSLRTYNPMEQHFTPLKLPINEVFNVFKDQPWLGAREQSSMISHFSEKKNIALVMTARDRRSSIAGPIGST